MKTYAFSPRYAPLLFPFLAGSAAALLTIWEASSAANGTDLEGALALSALLGWAVSLILPPIVFWIAVRALRGSQTSFTGFFLAVLVALAPVAYFQCANTQSSILLGLLSDGMNYVQLTRAYPTLLTETLAIFFAIAAVICGVLYQVARPKDA